MARVLTINCGSSSLKFALFAMREKRSSCEAERLASGRIGIGNNAAIRLSIGNDPDTHSVANVPDHSAAMRSVLAQLGESDLVNAAVLKGIGHRVVHGGAQLSEPTIIDDVVINQIVAVAALAPLHNDAAIAAIGTARQLVGFSIPMVAVFDTAFYSGMPERASKYAIPLDAADEHGIRRYGFHGLAHRSMAEHCSKMMDRPLERLKLITLQLGGGCSATAIENGRPIDTSMGFTPLEGLVMSARSGDIDPAVVRFLCERARMAVAAVEDWLNHKAGLLGVSGRSGDISTLLQMEAKGDAGAALALEMYCYRLRKYIGAYFAALQGADAIAFGGGVGENVPEIRDRVCRGMGWCGLILDEARNRQAVGTEALISADESRVGAYAISVDEEALIAHDTYRCLYDQ